MLAEVGTCVKRWDGGDGLRKREDDAAVDEAGDIGDEDLLGDVPPSVSKRIENTACLFFENTYLATLSIPSDDRVLTHEVRLNVAASCIHDVAQSHEQCCTSKTDRAPKVLCTPTVNVQDPNA